jgi:hypothetical protein
MQSIARIAATSTAILALGATIAAGPAAATYNSWAGSAPIDTQAAGSQTPDGGGNPFPVNPKAADGDDAAGPDGSIAAI